MTATTKRLMSQPQSSALPAFEVLPRDLQPYRRGNTGIDYVHRFESKQPGPHVLINGLTHGNEFCGMTACLALLDREVRPLRGTLTVSLANVEAYESFDTQRPFDSRQLVHNLNRIWSSDWLNGAEHSPELKRARELRPVVAAAEHILDIHSTSNPVQPFWVYPKNDINANTALALGTPAVHLVMPQGLGSGTPLIRHGEHGTDSAPGAALVVECGQHFAQLSSDLAVQVTLNFLAHFGLIDRVLSAPRDKPRRFELLRTCMVQAADFSFTRPLLGFERFEAGELIGSDSTQEIRAPAGGCTVLMPTRQPIVGREAVYLAHSID